MKSFYCEALLFELRQELIKKLVPKITSSAGNIYWSAQQHMRETDMRLRNVHVEQGWLPQLFRILHAQDCILQNTKSIKSSKSSRNNIKATLLFLRVLLSLFKFYVKTSEFLKYVYLTLSSYVCSFHLEIALWSLILLPTLNTWSPDTLLHTLAFLHFFILFYCSVQIWNRQVDRTANSSVDCTTLFLGAISWHSSVHGYFW